MIPSANLLRILLVPLTIISSKEKKVCFHSSPLKNTAKTLDIKRLPSTIHLWSTPRGPTPWSQHYFPAWLKAERRRKCNFPTPCVWHLRHPNQRSTKKYGILKTGRVEACPKTGSEKNSCQGTIRWPGVPPVASDLQPMSPAPVWRNSQAKF